MFSLYAPRPRRDLRALAFRWSRDEERYEDAARVYRTIVDQYDSTDAYAWEYLAYNLHRACREQPSTHRANEILAGYQRALELDRKNPLYHGRLLGFRAQLGAGDDVEIEFHRAVKRYVADYDRTEAVSYFAEPVLEGMARGAWGRRRFEVIRRWRPVLERFARLRGYLGYDGGPLPRID